MKKIKQIKEWLASAVISMALAGFIFAPIQPSIAGTMDANSDNIRVKNDTSSMWNDYRFGRPGYYDSVRLDFMTFDVDDWQMNEYQSASSQGTSDQAGGLLAVTTSGTDNDWVSLQYGGESILTATSNRNIYYQARISTPDATQCDWMIGLAQDGTNPTSTSNGVYFKKDDGDTNVDFINVSTAGGTSSTNVITTQSDGTTSFLTLGFHIVNRDYIDYYVNDVKIGTVTSPTTIPATEIKPQIWFQSGEGAAKTFFVDYVYVEQQK